MDTSPNVVPSPLAALTSSAASLTFAPSSASNTTEVPGEPLVTALPTEAATSHVLTYVFVPIGSIILVVLMAGIIVFLVRKSRLDKLRHHLMPLYNFDPAEEGEDWESELLEEGMDHRLTARMRMQVEQCSELQKHGSGQSVLILWSPVGRTCWDQSTHQSKSITGYFSVPELSDISA